MPQGTIIVLRGKISAGKWRVTKTVLGLHTAHCTPVCCSLRVANCASLRLWQFISCWGLVARFATKYYWKSYPHIHWLTITKQPAQVYIELFNMPPFANKHWSCAVFLCWRWLGVFSSTSAPAHNLTPDNCSEPHNQYRFISPDGRENYRKCLGGGEEEATIVNCS